MSSSGFYRVCFSEGPPIVVAYFQELGAALAYVERMGDACAFAIMTPDGRMLSDILRA